MKNPSTAGFLAILPGLGYIYNGYPQTGISAFIINTLLLGATYQSFKNNNNFLGTFCSIFGVGFYLGNIYGSIQASYKYNLEIKKDFYLKFKRTLFN